VAWDRWAADNRNSVTLAASGAGKSYLAKLEILRSLYQGTECWVIDPEDENARLARAVGGAYLRLGAPGVGLNPFDLPAAGRAGPDALTRRALFLHTVNDQRQRSFVTGYPRAAGSQDHEESRGRMRAGPMSLPWRPSRNVIYSLARRAPSPPERPWGGPQARWTRPCRAAENGTDRRARLTPGPPAWASLA